MFEVGNAYDITMLNWGETSPGPVNLYGHVVVAVEGTLVHFRTESAKFVIGGHQQEVPEQNVIVNTASLYFVKAEPTSDPDLKRVEINLPDNGRD